MSKISMAKTNFRVVIDLETWRYGKKREERHVEIEAEEIIAQCKRHVDGGDNAKIESDYVCAHCYEAPEINEEGPQCCQAAMDEWEKNKAAEKV